MSSEESFRLHPETPTQCEREVAAEQAESSLEIECVGSESDCYVKLGAEAYAFRSETSNILYSPDGRNLVFVQSYQGVPLYPCLVAVRNALHW